MRTCLVLLSVIVLSLLVAPAARSAGIRASEPWATVNVCDTELHPNQIGIRGSMPTRGRRTITYMRFCVQYQAGDEWRTIDAADSD